MSPLASGWRMDVGYAVGALALLCSALAWADPGGARWLITVADVVRCGCLVGAGVLMCATLNVVRTWQHVLSPFQAARFAGLPFVCLGVLGTELEHLHAEVTYRLPLFTAFLLYELYGVWGLRAGRDRLPGQQT